MTAADVDRENEAFWHELCGTTLAQSLGLIGRDRDTLEAFDKAYFAYYPYLLDYLDRFALAGRRVLEIGLGYGTLGQEIVRRGAEYHGLDIAEGPVMMMRHRLRMLGLGAEERIVAEGRIVQGSAASIPHPDAKFDFVYTIGCLHHTGALAASIEEVRRVMVPGGHAVVMLYHANSLRLIRVRVRSGVARLHGEPGRTADDIAGLYDADSNGRSAPFTEYVSRRQARDLFQRFAKTEITTRNFDDLAIRGRRIAPRTRLLGSTLERLLGLDLYVVAQS